MDISVSKEVMANASAHSSCVRFQHSQSRLSLPGLSQHAVSFILIVTGRRSDVSQKICGPLRFDNHVIDSVGKRGTTSIWLTNPPISRHMNYAYHISSREGLLKHICPICIEPFT